MNRLTEKDKVTGKLRTRENNDMSLSCLGEMDLKDNIIKSLYYKGMPRANCQDSWFGYYSNAQIGDFISPLTVQKILDYNGKNNIISILI